MKSPERSDWGPAVNGPYAVLRGLNFPPTSIKESTHLYTGTESWRINGTLEDRLYTGTERWRIQSILH